MADHCIELLSVPRNPLSFRHHIFEPPKDTNPYLGSQGQHVGRCYWGKTGGESTIGGDTCDLRKQPPGFTQIDEDNT